MIIIAKIDKEIAALEKKKAAIQKKCSHPATTKRRWYHEGNILTGRDDSSGVDYKCELCGAKWTRENPNDKG
jgi:hypothetical protein